MWREAFEMYVAKGERCITTASLKRMLSRLARHVKGSGGVFGNDL